MTNIDLKLLAMIGELDRTGSVSQTARRLGLGQSAVSMGLARLREHFRDELFVKTSVGMEPTPYGTEIIRELKRAEDILNEVLQHRIVFDPVSADRVFRIHSTDIAQVTLMPPLLAELSECAPSVRIDLQRISDRTPKVLESGEADLAVGFIPPMGPGFCQQRLFEERFVCAVRGDHPRVTASLTLPQFQREDHLGVEVSGTGHGIVDTILEEQKIRRAIRLTVPGFLGISSIIAATNFLAVLPAQLGQFLTRNGNIKIFELPFEVPPYFILQHWHERYGHDPANKWLRTVMAKLFLRSAEAGAESGCLATRNEQFTQP